MPTRCLVLVLTGYTVWSANGKQNSVTFGGSMKLELTIWMSVWLQTQKCRLGIHIVDTTES